MTDRLGAHYDDLALAPDTAFALALRGRLTARLDAEWNPTLDHESVEVLDMTITETPPEAEQSDARGGRTWWLVAAAVALAIAGAIVAARANNASSPATTTPPALTSVPPDPASETDSAPTTTESPFASDAQAAFDSMLQLPELDLTGYKIDMSRPLTFDGAVADELPACQRFATTVFESDSRPASVRSRVFQNTATNADLLMQYVVVFPTEQQAATMLDDMQDPAFLAECVPAYRSAVPTICCSDLPYWFPIFTGEEQEPPTLNVDADDMWVRQWGGSWSQLRDFEGVHPMLFAAIRVGRVVSLVDVLLEDGDGNSMATVHDVDRWVQRMAERAAQAQAVN